MPKWTLATKGARREIEKKIGDLIINEGRASPTLSSAGFIGRGEETETETSVWDMLRS